MALGIKLDTPLPSPEHDDGMTQRRCAVLIVEDDDKLQELLRTLIARHCTSVDLAADGERGIEMLREGTYDAVIVDLMLPKKNGLLVIEAIASLSYAPKVIVLSAISRYFQEQFPEGTMVLQKPFEIEKVANVIANLHEPQRELSPSAT
jgi:DNA-binding response OmpR family regulator